MEATTERRDLHQPRMPLDNVLVELRHDGFDEAFEADGLNVGPGGLSMRSAILPDVGTRLQCRFLTSNDATIDANAEVVWAEDNGPHVGEFGLRFTTISDSDQSHIEHMVQRWQNELEGGLVSDDAGTPTEPPSSVTLHLHGVAQPVVAELVHRSDDALLTEQPLPFLRVGTTIEDESGRRGELQAVDLRVEDGVPRLVLTIWYQDPAGQTTLSEEAVLGVGPSEAGSGRRTIDLEMTDRDSGSPGFSSDVGRPPESPQAVAVAEDWSAQGLADAEPEAAPVNSTLPPACALSASSAGAAAGAERGESAASAGLVAFDEGVVEESFPSRATQLRARVAKGANAVRTWMWVAWSKAVPLAMRVWRQGRRQTLRASRRVGPLMKALWAKRPRTSRPAGRRATRTARRTTTRPDAKSKVPEAPASEIRKGGHFRKGVTLVALIGLGGAAYALGASDSQVTAQKLATTKSRAPSTSPLQETGALAFEEISPPNNPGTSTSGEAPAADTSSAPAPALGMAADVTPVTTRALPEPTRLAGRMPAPEFPSLADEPAPTASPAPAGALLYGAASVPGGREFRLRMSQAVANLSGEQIERGFVVRVEGARALDGARRIARVLPNVERASILNQDNNAVLTVRFVGESPSYRVAAAGQSLTVTIGS